jgi:hypothetical protein
VEAYYALVEANIAFQIAFFLATTWDIIKDVRHFRHFAYILQIFLTC